MIPKLGDLVFKKSRALSAKSWARPKDDTSGTEDLGWIGKAGKAHLTVSSSTFDNRVLVQEKNKLKLIK